MVSTGQGERLVQALMRLVIIFIVAGVSAVGLNLTILKDAIDDPIVADLAFSILTSIIAGVLKYFGGVTVQPVTPVEGEPRARGASRVQAAKRPNIFAT